MGDLVYEGRLEACLDSFHTLLKGMQGRSQVGLSGKRFRAVVLSQRRPPPCCSPVMPQTAAATRESPTLHILMAKKVHDGGDSPSKTFLTPPPTPQNPILFA